MLWIVVFGLIAISFALNVACKSKIVRVGILLVWMFFGLAQFIGYSPARWAMDREKRENPTKELSEDWFDGAKKTAEAGRHSNDTASFIIFYLSMVSLYLTLKMKRENPDAPGDPEEAKQDIATLRKDTSPAADE